MSINVKGIEEDLGEYASLVTIKHDGNQFIIRLKEFLKDKSQWETINQIVRSIYKGVYVSKAKGGPEWVITIMDRSSQPAKPSVKSQLQGIVDQLGRIINELPEGS